MSLQEIFYNWIKAQNGARPNAAFAVPVKDSTCQGDERVCYPLPGICQSCGSNPALGVDDTGLKLCGSCLMAG